MADQYWPYGHEQCSNVHNAINGVAPPSGGRVMPALDKLRTPFCLAYARTPAPYRNGKLAPQAEACMHLGYSRDKHGYILEVIEGPRKGRVITSSQVKFREDVFPMRGDWKPVGMPLWCDVDDVEFEIDGEDDDDDDEYNDMPVLGSDSEEEGGE